MSKPINNGGPAFPEAGLSGLPNGDVIYGRSGMSLRDWFAGQAINGILSQPPSTFLASHKSLWEPSINDANSISQFLSHVADIGYAVADAMLAAREKGQE